MSGFLPRLFASRVHAVGKRAGDQHTNVRTLAGQAICTTIYSWDLDYSGEAYKDYTNREAVAERIALLWNACRNLSTAELNAMAERNG